MFELTICIILQTDWNETMIHDPVLGVNIFMPIVTGTKLGLVVHNETSLINRFKFQEAIDQTF